MNILVIFSYGFIERALLAGIFVGIACAILGLFLVLKNLSLIGDGLSHVSFGALALGLFLGIYPYYIAMPLVIVGALIIYLLSTKFKILGDAAIGIVSAVSISVGVILSSIGNGFNLDLMSLLFGNILTISPTETLLSIVLTFIILTIIMSNYHNFVATTFNEDLAQTSGVNVKFINYLLFILTAMTVMLTIKVAGIMLTSALLIMPATSALQLARSFKVTLFAAIFISIVSIFSGIIVSFVVNWPTGATIVLTNLAIMLIIVIDKKLIK